MLDDRPILETTPLHALHRELGAKLVGFAGYDMPVQYPAGILKEHLHTRHAAGLFDVSHMGQVHLRGPDVAAALETLVPADIQGLKDNQTRYTMFTTETGDIIDDLMVTRLGPDFLQLIVNAGGKKGDLDHLRAHLTSNASIEYLADQALLALQGPLAAYVMAEAVPGIEDMAFMTGMQTPLFDVPAYITRSGYTGEDGYEISIPAENAEFVARRLLANKAVMAIGLGARDSLRLEAGLCLYGHDIDLSTSPIEADLAWSIGRRRREHGGFKGAHMIQQQLAHGPSRRRVGLLPVDRAPAREGTEILDEADAVVGVVTSGGFSPSLDRPIAMGYVPTALAEPGTRVHLSVRGRRLPADVTALPFVPTRYFRKKG
jgi:aminomethyltransferase